MIEQKGSVSRRDFMELAAAAATTVAAVSSTLFPVFGEETVTGSFVPIVKLPYGEDALAPYISARTVNLHYSKHHRSYWELVNGWLKNDPERAKLTLEQIIASTRGGVLRDESQYFMSVLLYNHNLYWPSMKPGGGGRPDSRNAVAKAIDASFGSYDKFRTEFVSEAMKLGSGWVFLVDTAEGLDIMRTDYHDSPLVYYFTPLITIDVWEHAYYLDYLNDREKYVNVFLDKLVNWEFAGKNLASSRRK